MTYEIESEVDNMCNYSDGVYNLGFEKGINQGISRGEILSYIRIIASKIRRGKSRETIMQDIFDNDEQQVYEYNDLYDIVEYNPEHSENELADMYMKNKAGICSPAAPATAAFTTT